MAQPAGDLTEAQLRALVGPDVVARIVARVAGDPIAVGPLRAGPGGAATARATGRLGQSEVRQTGSAPLTFRVLLPLTLGLRVQVAGGTYRYDCEARIALTVTALPLAGWVEVEPAELSPRDVQVTVKARGIQARVLQTIGDVDAEVRRTVASYVNGRLADPEVLALARVALPPG